MPDDLPDHHVLDLSGPWRTALDPDGVGEHERWYRPSVLDAVATRELTLPGSVQEQGFGDPVTLETPWTGLVVDRSFYEDERYAPYREDGNVSVPFWLQPHTYYRGAVWFQRTVDVPRTGPGGGSSCTWSGCTGSPSSGSTTAGRVRSAASRPRTATTSASWNPVGTC